MSSAPRPPASAPPAFGQRHAAELHRAVGGAPDGVVEGGELGRLLREVLAEVAAAALLAFHRRAGDRPPTRSAGCAGRAPCASRSCTRGGRRRRPARRARSAPRSSPIASRISLSVRTMPTRLLHRRPAGPAAPCTGSRRCRRARTAPARPCIARSTAASSTLAGRCVLGVLRGVLAGALAEHDQVGERVAAEAVGAVDPGRAFAGREQARARVDSCVSASTRTPPMM